MNQYWILPVICLKTTKQIWAGSSFYICVSIIENDKQCIYDPWYQLIAYSLRSIWHYPFLLFHKWHTHIVKYKKRPTPQKFLLLYWIAYWVAYCIAYWLCVPTLCFRLCVSDKLRQLLQLPSARWRNDTVAEWLAEWHIRQHSNRIK